MITEIIDKALTEGREEWQKKRVYASDLGSCHRKVFYAFRPEIPKPARTAKSLRRMELGVKAQEMEGRILYNAGILVASEVPIRDGPLGGRADWQIRTEDGGTTYAEVKTVGDWDARALAGAPDKLAWVKANKRNYLWQILYYLTQTGRPWGLLHFIGMNGDSWDVPVVVADLADEITAMNADIDALGTIAGATEPPNRCSKDPSKTPCSWCDYKDHCWAGAVPEAVEVTETDEELVLRWLALKETEAKTKTELESLRPQVEARLKERNGQPIITEIGGLKYQERKSTEYDVDKLREILLPLGLFEEVLEFKASRLKDLVKGGFVQADLLKPATTETTGYSIVQIKEA